MRTRITCGTMDHYTSFKQFYHLTFRNILTAKSSHAKLVVVLILFLSLMSFGWARTTHAGWTSIGPDGGKINALAIGPQNAQSIYAATGSGLFESINNGETWSLINSIEFGAIAIDPMNTNIIYAGYGANVSKSTDGGTTWSNSRAVSENVSCIMIDPQNTNILYAGDGSGSAYKSTDGGITWFSVGCYVQNVHSIAIGKQNTKIVYVGNWDNTKKTTDGGATWTNVGIFRAAAVAIDPSDVDTVYIGTDFWRNAALFKSRDGSETFEQVFYSNTSGSVSSIAIDPQNSQTIYIVSPNGIHKSTDAGITWSKVYSVSDSVRVRSIEIDPQNTQNIYAGTFQHGVFKSNDGGSTWGQINSSLHSIPIHKCIIDPRSPQTIYAVDTTGLGFFKSNDAGRNWGEGYGSVPSVLAVDPQNVEIFYGRFGTVGLSKSTDAGTTWSVISSDLANISCIAVDPLNTQIIYAGTKGYGVYKSTDGGYTMKPINSGLPSSANITTLAIDPQNPQIVYAGPSYKSTDGGATWTSMAVNFNTMAIDSLTPQILYATNGSIYKSTNSGSTWSPINSGLPASYSITSVLIDPVNTETLYAVNANSTDYSKCSIYRSVDGGQNWTFANLSGVYINSLAIDPIDTEIVYASTKAGVFVSSNAGGEISAPDAPTNVLAYSGDRQATITFAAPFLDGGSPVTSYTVTSTPDDISVSGTASPITVTGLANGKEYTFTVKAANTAGVGPASNPSNRVIPGKGGSLSVTIGPASAVSAGAMWKVDAGAWQTSGAVLSNLGIGSHTVSFKDIPNWKTPDSLTANIVEGETTSIAIDYMPRTASLTVTITPQSAIDAGAQWRLTGESAWRNSGTANDIPAGQSTVEFKDIDDWIKPSNQTVSLVEGENKSVRVSYSLSNTISGIVTNDGVGFAGVSINLSGDATMSTITDSNGHYSFKGLKVGSYWVTPTSEIVFGPSSSYVLFGGEGLAYICDFSTLTSISGSVSVDGIGLVGVIINLTGDATRSTTTDSNGYFNFKGLKVGSYTITPSLPGYSFSPLNSSLEYAGEAIYQYFSVYFIIEGAVTDNGTGLAGVTVSLTGTVTKSTTTDSDGHYSFTIQETGSYTVTPNKGDFSFSPPFLSTVFNGGEDVSVMNFATTSYSISGTVTNNGAGLSGATVTLTGSANKSTTTDSNGYFSFDDLQVGSYMVTPSKTGLKFLPESLPIHLVGSTWNAFTAVSSHSISGTVTLNGSGLSGVAVDLSGTSTSSTTTDTSGKYVFTGLTNGGYAVTASKSGYTFNPPSISVTVDGSDVTEGNFLAMTDVETYSISGSVTSSGVGLVGVAVDLSGTSTSSTTTDTSGKYVFTGLTNGGYAVTASKSGYTFNPPSISVTVDGSDVTEGNFLGEQMDLLTADFTASPTSGKAPLKVSFSEQSNGTAYKLLWDFGDGKTSQKRNPIHTYKKPGTYTVKLTVRGYLSETHIKEKTAIISASAPLKAKFSASPKSGQAPLTVNFTNSSTGDISEYQWDFGDGQTSNERTPLPHVYNDPGRFVVTLTVVGPLGNSTKHKNINVKQ